MKDLCRRIRNRKATPDLTDTRLQFPTVTLPFSTSGAIRNHFSTLPVGATLAVARPAGAAVIVLPAPTRADLALRRRTGPREGCPYRYHLPSRIAVWNHFGRASRQGIISGPALGSGILAGP